MDTEEAFAAKCEEYAEAQGLRELMESLMRLLLQQQPKDPLQCLIDHLQQHQPELESQEGQQEEQQEEKAQQKQGPLLRLVLLGLPGSGRREVSRQLAEEWNLPLVSAGTLLRLHAEKNPKGEAARAIATKSLGKEEASWACTAGQDYSAVPELRRPTKANKYMFPCRSICMFTSVRLHITVC